MENLLKILELLNKPIHFFVIGLFVLIWGVWIQFSLDSIFVGALLILLGVSSWIDKYWKERQNKKQMDVQKANELKKQARLRNQIIQRYEAMLPNDRHIIDFCLDNGYPVFQDSYSIYKGSIVSLCSQGWGVGNNFDHVFTMDTKYFNILTNYKKEQKSVKKQKKGKKHDKD